jgi:aspartyl-tRNA(Asn)/glutamyl-tRNA(Gln) amidotransferase subunit C
MAVRLQFGQRHPFTGRKPLAFTVILQAAPIVPVATGSYSGCTGAGTLQQSLLSFCNFPKLEKLMSVDARTVRRVAHLARIAVSDADVPKLQDELNAMLGFVEQLNEVDIDGIEPLTSVTPMLMKQRADVVNDGEMADAVTANAPASEDHFFMVPKVVE